jgi:glycerophosphoryl diester phosphodiesterase
MLIYAHRGSSGTEPENTLRAFRQAIADGADGVEFDVHATRDGVPVVLHDRRLERTTNGHGDVDAHTLAELRTLDAGKGETIPSLSEVLDVVSGRLAIDLELKQAGIEAEVLAALADYPDASWAISSFNWECLKQVRGLSPEAELWVLAQLPTEDAFRTAKELAASTLALWSGAVSPDSARRCSEADLDLMVWTVNETAVAKQAALHGAAALCTDLPKLIRDGLTSGS